MDGMGHIRDFLSAEWSRGGPLVNGEALTSRISRISLCSKSTVTSRKEDIDESFAHHCLSLSQTAVVSRLLPRFSWCIILALEFCAFLSRVVELCR